MITKCPHCGRELNTRKLEALGTRRYKRASNKKRLRALSERTLLHAENHYRRWDSSDVAFLKDRANVETAESIALSLGRTYRAVTDKAGKEKIHL